MSMWDDPEYDWIFKTVPQTHGNDRVIGHPRGKQLGGSSAINFNYWTHASQRDINDWGALGNPGWSWDELLPYYLKSETYTSPPAAFSEKIDTSFTDPSVHGERGPVQDSFPPFYDDFYAAWEPTYKNLGLGPNGDPKGGLAIGAYTTLLTLDPRNASRSYAGNAYYKPNAGRDNLKVLTGALATKINFVPGGRNSSALVATGVEFAANGTTLTVNAKKEVILSAGAFQSPQLLELSGIGDPKILESLGVDVHHANPSIGENLQDHILIPLGFQVKPGEPTFESLRNETVLAEALEIYAQNHTGPLASGTSNAYVSLEQVQDALQKRMLFPYQTHHQQIDTYPAPLPPSLLASVNSKASKREELLLQKLESAGEAAFQEVYLPGGFAPPFAENVSELFTPDPKLYPGNYFSMLSVLEHPFSRGSVHISSKDPTVVSLFDAFCHQFGTTEWLLTCKDNAVQRNTKADNSSILPLTQPTSRIRLTSIS